jgi:hypothetical protein
VLSFDSLFKGEFVFSYKVHMCSASAKTCQGRSLNRRSTRKHKCRRWQGILLPPTSCWAHCYQHWDVMKFVVEMPVVNF